MTTTTPKTPWCVFWRREYLGCLYTTDIDQALDIASVQFAPGRFPVGDDSELWAARPWEA